MIVTCEKCGQPRSTVLKVCGGCLQKARGEKPREPMPLTDEERKVGEMFLNKINGTAQSAKKTR